MRLVDDPWDETLLGEWSTKRVDHGLPDAVKLHDHCGLRKEDRAAVGRFTQRFVMSKGFEARELHDGLRLSRIEPQSAAHACHPTPLGALLTRFASHPAPKHPDVCQNWSDLQ